MHIIISKSKLVEYYILKQKARVKNAMCLGILPSGSHVYRLENTKFDGIISGTNCCSFERMTRCEIYNKGQYF